MSPAMVTGAAQVMLAAEATNGIVNASATMTKRIKNNFLRELDGMVIMVFVVDCFVDFGTDGMLVVFGRIYRHRFFWWISMKYIMYPMCDHT